MNTIVKKLAVASAAAGTGVAIDRTSKRPTGAYPTPTKVAVTVVGSLAVLYVGAFLEKKLGLHD